MSDKNGMSPEIRAALLAVKKVFNERTEAGGLHHHFAGPSVTSNVDTEPIAREVGRFLDGLVNGLPPLTLVENVLEAQDLAPLAGAIGQFTTSLTAAWRVQTDMFQQALAKLEDCQRENAEMLSQLLRVLAAQEPPQIHVAPADVQFPEAPRPLRLARGWRIKHDDGTESTVERIA